MSDVTVRPLGEDDWEQFRAIRLAALTESPEAFVASAEQEEAFDQDLWRERMRRSTRFVAEQGDAPVGVVSLGESGDEEGRVAEIFGLWVHPVARGSGVATKLVEATAGPSPSPAAWAFARPTAAGPCGSPPATATARTSSR